MNKKKLISYTGKVIFEGVKAVCIAAALDVISKGIESRLMDDDIVEGDFEEVYEDEEYY